MQRKKLKLMLPQVSAQQKPMRTKKREGKRCWKRRMKAATVQNPKGKRKDPPQRCSQQAQRQKRKKATLLLRQLLKRLSPPIAVAHQSPHHRVPCSRMLCQRRTRSRCQSQSQSLKPRPRPRQTGKRLRKQEIRRQAMERAINEPKGECFNISGDSGHAPWLLKKQERRYCWPQDGMSL